MKINRIWFGFDEWGKGELNPQNDNCDVIVTLNNNEKWMATFFTIENLKSIMKSYKKSGECLFGSYFWASEMIIIEEISKAKIEKAILDLIKNKEFKSIFKRVNE